MVFSCSLLVTIPAAYGGEVKTMPPAPTLLPDVHNFEVVYDAQKQKDVYHFTNPYIPPLTQSYDHRIGLVLKRTGSDNNQAVFHLLVPEQLDDELMLAGAGATILDDVAVEVDADYFHNAEGDVGTGTHFALCDPREGSTQNPYVCNTDNDCYNLKVITAVQLGGSPPQIQLWSTPVTVEVDQPKTANAEISSVSTGTPVGGTPLVGKNFRTPMIVGDNRLLVVRVGSVDLSWKDNSGNQQPSKYYNAAYAYYADGEECDITKWTEFKPLAFAPEDDDLENADGDKRFGFIEYPFRTPSGAAINSDPSVAALADLGVHYLWLDQKANNVFFASLNRKLIDGDSSCTDPPFICNHLYDLSCVAGTSCTDPYAPNAEGIAQHQGWMAMGLWTHGKMVLLDSMVNHSDWGLLGEEQFHRDVSLFSTGSDVRVGAGRDASVIRIGNDPETDPYGWVRSTVQFGSQEHFFNMVPHMRPRTPRDVVWQITTGGRTDEIAFDDYVSVKTLIFSPMNALKEMVGSVGYYDGNDPAYPEMRLQNAATTLKWNPPSYGQVVLPQASPETKGRIENVALGGIKARGFHLDPETGIKYVIPDQPTDPSTETERDMTDKVWLVSLFLDRTDASWGEIRPLVTFPSGAKIELSGLSKIKVCPAGSNSCPAVTMPKPIYKRGWSHFAFHLDPAVGTIRFFQDGFLFAELALPGGMEIETGTLTVGSPDSGTTKGIGGWIDEFKVIEGPFTYEEVCNHARGTLVAVPSSYTNAPGVHLADLLKPFNDAASNTNAVSGREAVHKALYGPAAVVTSDTDYYVCNIDYQDPMGISVHNPGDANARSIRVAELVPEGTLLWNQYRPDSTGNAFCGSCHSDDEKAGLTLEALVLDTSQGVAQDDKRRQPFQAPPMMLGYLPAGYFAGGKPSGVQESTETKIDQWIHDGPFYRWTFDEGGGTTVRNWAIGDPQATSTAGTIHGAAFQPGNGRGHALELDGGKGGPGGSDDDLDHVLIDHAIDVAGDQMTLAVWMRLGVDGIPYAPEDRCQNFQSATPCTIIAKSADGSNHDVDWSLRVFYRVNDAHPTWRAQFLVKTGTTVKALTPTLIDLPTQNPDDFVSTNWHHLAATFNDGKMAIFLDGELRATSNIGSSSLVTDPSHEVTLGSKLSTGGAPLHPFYGLLDDVRIYNRTLLDWEIEGLASVTP